MLVQIVPRLPPATDGLGDYALILARELRSKFGICTRFIVCDTTWNGADRIEDFSIEPMTSHSASSLRSRLNESHDASAVLLHYVGYGYAKRGAPIWLIRALNDWQKHSHKAQLLTMFHEVYASGPLWTSAFWFSPVQKHLASLLARLSDVCFTSRQGYAEILSELSQRKHYSILSIPVFSSIGEPQQKPRPLNDRKRRLVIFGGRSSRLRVYKNSRSTLASVCRALAIEEIVDIGPPIDLIVDQISGSPLIRRGERPAAEISVLLSDSVAGFFDYHPAYLAKSTIFAAYSAHGLIPVIASCDSAGQVDGLEAGKHYWTADAHEKTLSLTDGQEIADSAYRWYQAHKLSEHVKTFAGAIGFTKKTALVCEPARLD